jgi:hypothetical protein
MSGPGKWTPPKKLPTGRTLAEMRAEFELGVNVFTACWDAPITRVAIENPVMNDLARERMPPGLPAPHMVQPHWFGHRAYKTTGWYLRGLPPLRPTDPVPEPERGSAEWRAWNAIHRMLPGPERARLRSRSFPGMMAAAAMQWAPPPHLMQKDAAEWPTHPCTATATPADPANCGARPTRGPQMSPATNVTAAGA